MFATVTRRRRASAVRGLLLLALASCAAFLVWILLSPDPSLAFRTVTSVSSLLQRFGVPASLAGSAHLEFVLNVAMVVPLTFIAQLLWPRVGWERWTAYVLLLACAVELLQGLLLPQRAAQFVDVVANALGAATGAALAQLLLGMSSRATQKDAAARDASR